ncbi:MAG TPA: iron-containing alcohol dehydrogenase, partial [Thermodesulfobacteriota bacterium]|nr:iron-containing alcohol dehydrogenase [Thermodesulfobacteriota bacterium]
MMSQTFQFKAPSVIVNGPGAAKEIGNFAKRIGKKALIVTDANLEKIGLPKEVMKSLEIAGVPFAIFSRVVIEPTQDNVEEGVKAYKEAGVDFLIAVGGGSSMDT